MIYVKPHFQTERMYTLTVINVCTVSAEQDYPGIGKDAYEKVEKMNEAAEGKNKPQQLRSQSKLEENSDPGLSIDLDLPGVDVQIDANGIKIDAQGICSQL